MSKNRLYWYCQIGGWLFFDTIEVITYGNIFGYNKLLFINGFVNFIIGLVLTHAYRNILMRSKWLSKPLNQLLPLAIVAVLIMSVIMTFLNVWLDRMTIPLLQQLPIDFVLLSSGFFNWAKYILLWMLIYHLFQYWEKSLTDEKTKFQLRAILRDNEYNNLKAQVNPHFLFNSLNSIRTLIDLDSELSKEAITRLSSLLRSSLEMSKHKVVSFRKELETVKDYLAIEKIRFDSRLQTQFNIEDACLSKQIPPMLLQTLVENGVKHGISNLKAGGIIQVEAHVKNNNLCIRIINSGQYKPINTSGVGVENTRQRLQLLYDDKASFQIGNLDNENVQTEIIIPDDTHINH